jgi:hypothetical protein
VKIQDTEGMEKEIIVYLNFRIVIGRKLKKINKRPLKKDYARAALETWIKK